MLEGYIVNNGFLLLFTHGQGCTATPSCSLLHCIMHEVALQADTLTQKEGGKKKHKKADLCIVQFVRVKNNLGNF